LFNVTPSKEKNMSKLTILALALLLIGSSLLGCGSDDPATPNPTPAAKGTVTVSITPGGISASWTLAGPDGYSHSGTDSETLTDLKVGDYTLTWGPAAGYGTPNPTMETKTLTDGATVTFSVQYHLVAGTVALDLTNVDLTQAGYVRIADDPALEPQVFTIEAWVSPQGPGYAAGDAYGAAIFGKYREGTAGRWLGSWGISWSASDEIVTFGVINQIGVDGVSIATPLGTTPVNTTFHVAATFDGNTLTLYINGAVEATGAYTYSGVDYGDEDVLIGAANLSSGWWRRFDGVIDEIRLWDHARSQAQITGSMTCRLSGDETGLLGYWGFENNDLTDESGNGHDGVAENVTPNMVNLVTPEVSLSGCQ